MGTIDNYLAYLAGVQNYDVSVFIHNGDLAFRLICGFL